MDTILHTDVLLGLNSLESNSVALIVIDPPYFLTGHSWDKKQFKDLEDYLTWCESWLNECSRILKPEGAFYSFQDWRVVSEYVILLKQIFPYFQNWITWERIKGRSSAINWKSTKEELLYFSKVKKPIFYEQKKIRPVIAPYKDAEGKPKGWIVDEEGNRVRWTGVGNVWHYTPPVFSSKVEKPQHPTQKPVMMLERIIQAHTTEGDTVLDCFAGSGSTGVAAKNLNRNFILIEKEQKYIDLCKNRLYNG